MMTTEVFNGNEQPTRQEQETAAILRMGQLLQEKDEKILDLERQVADLKDLLQSK
jgi:hypothetical protein